jgi:ATP synthase protein I
MAGETRFSTVWKVLYAQILITIAVAIVFWGISGGKLAISALSGGGIALIPNLFFALKIYLARNSQPQDMVNAFYIGETIKLVLTAALFAIAFQFRTIDFVTLLVGYIAVLSVFWFALIYWRN